MQAPSEFEYNPSGEPSVRILPSDEASEGTRNRAGHRGGEDQPEFTPSLTPKQVRIRHCYLSSAN